MINQIREWICKKFGHRWFEHKGMYGNSWWQIRYCPRCGIVDYMRIVESAGEPKEKNERIKS